MKRALPVLAVVVACSPVTPVGTSVTARLRGAPAELSFLCVSPGCDTQRTATFTVEGSRRLVLKRFFVEGDDASELDVQASEMVPAVLGPGGTLDLTVRYRPTGAPATTALTLVVTYADAAPTMGTGAAEPGEVRLPVLRRVLGEAVLSATPSALSFGFVAAGSSKTLPVTLRNEGRGTVYAVVDHVDGGTAELRVDEKALAPIAPDAGLSVPVRFSPKGESHVSTTFVFVPQGQADSVSVTVEGTSISTARAVFEPAGPIDFGELPRGQKRVMKAVLANHGGAALPVNGLSLADPSGNVKLTAPVLTGPVMLQSLERLPVELEVTGTTPGPVQARLQVVTPGLPVVLEVGGLVTAPSLQVSPATLDFGAAATTWVTRKPVELKNVGYGPLTVKALTLTGSSSSLFSLSSQPPLPVVLGRNERTVVEVQFRAETAGTFQGNLSVETDAQASPFTLVPLKGQATTCAVACPLAHATAACSTGACTVMGCASGWYDTDAKASTGCECEEPQGTDPGAFCATGKDLGNFKDTSHTQATVVGVVPVDGDVDLIRFHAEDAFQVGSDDFNVKVKLDSADPTLQLCVYRYDTGSAQPDCFFTNESCPTDRSFQKGGGLGGDDADFVVKVSRAPNKGPTCVSYTLSISNG